MKLKRKILSVLLVISMSFGMVMSAGATNLGDMRDKAQELEDQKKEAENEKSTLVDKLKRLEKSMDQTQIKLDEKRAEMDEIEQDLVQAKIEENEQFTSMKLRIRYMYENGTSNLLEIFLESESIVDFFNRAEYIKTMSEYDRKKLDEFQLIVQEVEEKETALKTEFRELNALQTTLVRQSNEAEKLLNEKSAELATLDSELGGLKNKIKNAEAEERRRQEAAQSGGGGGTAGPPVVSGNGYFTHPCPGMRYQSSYFGEVRQGIGDTRPHQGHDYAAAAGTPIYAAAAGTVVIAGYSSSAGYWVVINHGNGLVTKYMHMYCQPFVSAGQQVVKGQHIGGVGTTGQSTGNHLHFQVELNGKAVNPSLYM